MQVTRINRSAAATSLRSTEAAIPAAGARGSATGFDRASRLEAIRTEMRNAVAFTAKAHHGWGGPDPSPAPNPTPTPVPAPLPAE